MGQDGMKIGGCKSGAETQPQKSYISREKQGNKRQHEKSKRSGGRNGALEWDPAATRCRQLGGKAASVG